MKTFFALANTFILLVLAALHFYWAFGGKKGIKASIPTNSAGKNMLNPGFLVTFAVGIGLVFMALLHLEKIQIIYLTLPDWLSNYSLQIIAAIFLLRAIGDFLYVGFFKLIKNTPFAEMDTKFYSPLSILLSLNAFLTTII